MKLALNDLLTRWIHPPNLSRDDGIRYYQERLLNTLLLVLVFPTHPTHPTRYTVVATCRRGSLKPLRVSEWPMKR